MSPPGPPSRTRTVAVVGALFAAAVAAGLAGVPSTVIALVVSGIGTAVIFGDRARRRLHTTQARSDGAMDRFPVAFAAERMAVGSLYRFRVGAARAQSAPGVLCVAHGVARFFPAKAKHDDRAWQGVVDRAEMVESAFSVCGVRLHGPDGPVQFAIQRPHEEVRAALVPYLRFGD